MKDDRTSAREAFRRALQIAAPMDLLISLPDRFCLILRITAARDLLRVHD